MYKRKRWRARATQNLIIPGIGRRKSVTKQINVLPYGILQRPLRLMHCLQASGD